VTRHYQDTDTRRRQVAEAALRTIVEDGVAGFTTKAVAERVGINDSTLFRHFGSKAEIVLEAMRLLDAEMELGLISTGDLAADLEGFFRQRAAFVGAEASVGRLVFSDEFLHLAGEPGRQCIEGWRKKSVTFLMNRLTRLQQAGCLRSDLDLQSMGMFVQGTLLTFAMQASLRGAEAQHVLQGRIDKAWAALHTILFR
jgi:AcrR family transcriptional regulator